MTTYEPGRIYSGIVDGKQRTLICALDKVGAAAGFLYAKPYDNDWRWKNASLVHDVRGPLVVLDLADYPLHAQTWRQFVQCLREPDSCGVVDCIADQIEQQTRPPLRVGWHEVKELPHPMYFGGDDWRYAPSRLRPKDQSLTSTHYIGPASGDQS